MNLPKGVQEIRKYLARMDKQYGGKIFEEFSIISLNAEQQTNIHHFEGGGRTLEEMSHGFDNDIDPLWKELKKAQKESIGSYHFDQDAEGTLYDAFMKVGRGIYVIFNNAKYSMTQIKAKGSWLKAQIHFVELSEIFFKDPIVLKKRG